MHRTTRDQERRIFDLYFQGYSHIVIAAKVGEPPSTVSEVISVLPDRVKHLRSLAIELNKTDTTVFEAKRGAELRARLDNLGVGFDRMQSYVESSEKMQTNPDYKPNMILEAAMKLNDLEQETGKTYSEILPDFEIKKNKTETLEKTEREISERIALLKKKEKQNLSENKVTEDEIVYVVNLRQNYRKNGVELKDVEFLKELLDNVREIGGDPRKFVEYTEEDGSLQTRAIRWQLEETEQRHVIQRLKEEEKNVRDEVTNAQSEKTKLTKQKNAERARLLTAREELKKTEQKHEEKLERLGQILKVEPKAEKITDALKEKEARLSKLDGEIAEKEAKNQSLDEKTRELESKKTNIEQEIETRLGIRDYATQLQTGIAGLQHQQSSLTKETDQKKEKNALVDTVTAFLTRQPYEFDRFYSYVEQMKILRKSAKYQGTIQVTAAEEQARSMALGAFKGFLPTNEEHATLKYQKECAEKEKAEQKTQVSQLKSKLEETENKLKTALEEKQLAETVKANFGGKSTTIGEIKNWVIATYRDEIQKGVDAKYNSVSALTRGILDFAASKLFPKRDEPLE